MSQEVELKLTFPPAALPEILRHPAIATASKVGKAQTLINTYFDTANLHLRKEKIALRTRKAGHQWLQTVKCASASVGGLSARPEWEQPYRDKRFDFSSIDDDKARALLERHADDLRPCFTTEFKRDTRRLVLADGSVLLLMVDVGVIDAGTARAPIHELELELESGSAERLLNFAIELARDLPLMPQDISKAQRGFMLFLNEPEQPVHARASLVRAEHTPLQAFQAIARDLLFAWQANAVGTREHGGAEFIHQLRVALRRLRTALGIFAPVLPHEFRREWSAQLRELAKQVGVSRDFQVIRESVVQPALSNADIAGAALLMERLDAALAASINAAQQSLRVAPSGVAILRFYRDVRAIEEYGQLAGHHIPLIVFAQRALADLRKQCRKRFRVAEETETEEALHDLRIALKRFRYGLEFFAPLFESQSVRATQKKIAQIQTDLGTINDLAMANTTLAQWAADDAQLREVHGFVAGWHAPGYARLRRKSVARARKLLWHKAVWKKAIAAPVSSRKEK